MNTENKKTNLKFDDTCVREHYRCYTSIVEQLNTFLIKKSEQEWN